MTSNKLRKVRTLFMLLLSSLPMKTINLRDGHTVSLLLSARELTAGRYADFQYYITQDVGIGSSEESVERHFANLVARLTAAQHNPEQLGAAADELVLLHYNFQFMVTRYQPKQLAFAVLVGAVDGVAVNDPSEDALTALVSRLSDYGLTQGQVDDFTAEFLKKKPVN